MPRLSKVVLLLVVMLVVSVGGLAQTLTPIPEMKNFPAGKWVNQEEVRRTPEGPWEKVSWTSETRMVGGFSWENHYAVMGGASGVEVYGYDPHEKTRFYVGVDDRGGIAGGTWEWRSAERTLRVDLTSTAPDGSQSQRRCTATVAADSQSWEMTCERPTDGKWWVFRKVKGTKQ